MKTFRVYSEKDSPVAVLGGMVRAVNGFVRADWPRAEVVGGMQLLDAWYDRPYEYAWAIAHLSEIEREVGRPLRILDVGPGAYQPWVDELVARGHSVRAIDVDQEAVAGVRARLPVVDAAVADGKTEDVSGFDLVTCVSSLEHDPDWRALAANLGRARRLLLTLGVVGPGGGVPYGTYQMFLGMREVYEMLAILANAGALGEVNVDPIGAFGGHGGLLLTLVLRTERAP